MCVYCTMISSACWRASGKSSIHQAQRYSPSASRRDRRKAARKHGCSCSHTHLWSSLANFSPLFPNQFPSVGCCCCCSCAVIYCDDCGLCHRPSLSSASSVHVRKLSLFLTNLALTCWHFSPLPTSLHPPLLLSFSLPHYLKEDESAKGKRTKWAEHDEMFALLLTDTVIVKEGTKERRKRGKKNYKKIKKTNI